MTSFIGHGCDVGSSFSNDDDFVWEFELEVVCRGGSEHDFWTKRSECGTEVTSPKEVDVVLVNILLEGIGLGMDKELDTSGELRI